MSLTVSPHAVVVTRPTELDELLARHGTREQARFFLRTRGLEMEAVDERHRRLQEALREVQGAIPLDWRRSHVVRADLDRFLFGPDDVVVVVGQDGLVANVAKYLDGQPVIGVNPDPKAYDGILVPHAPGAVARLLAACAAGDPPEMERTMVSARLDDGQSLLALNEVFVGHRSHQSARYRIRWQGNEERHSSSGLIVATGTGATGWALSISRQVRESPPLPAPEEAALCFFVREPFPSIVTGTSIRCGVVDPGSELEVVSEMNEGGVVFGDGIEADRLDLSWGQTVRVGVAGRRLRLVGG